MIILAFVKYVAKMLRKSLDASAWNVKHVTNMVIQDASVMVGRDVRRSPPDAPPQIPCPQASRPTQNATRASVPEGQHLIQS
jgi:hypothetical protein